MTTTVLVLDPRGCSELADLPGVDVLFHDPGSSELADDARAAQVLVAEGGSVDQVAALAAEMPALRLVQTTNAGVETWVGRLPEQVQLSNGRGAHGASTAEWALAGLLAVYRDLVSFANARTWSDHPTETLMGKHVLIVGAGDLATELAVRLDACGASSTLVGRTRRDGVHAIDELGELVATHDAVVLMLPLTEQTRGLVDADLLARMPDHAILVNAARGGVVDTDALLVELRAQRLRAVLDVTDPEPLPEDHPLWGAPGLLLTPHVGGFSEGRDERAWAVTRANVAAVARGEEPPNLVR
ncbi:MAG: NAD(P)-dependent oxidoreductase [Mycobacteriaceae bacterium]